MPHHTQPTVGHTVNLHVIAALLQSTKPAEWNDPSSRTHPLFENPPIPVAGLFHLPQSPGLGLKINQSELDKRRR
jgi:L-alanine-DL-glutamate epimerase-like enolase superfamily enzyme